MQEFSGKQYLEIAIANAFGLDKKVWQDRLDWVHDNRKQLEMLDVDAKSPFMFRKAVRALRDVEQGKPTNFIMDLDSTNSGLQVFSILTQCVSTAMKTNVINTGNRENAYQYARDFMANIMGVCPSEIDEEQNKQTVMVAFYNSDAEPRKAYGEGTRELAAFYQMLLEAFPGPYKARNLIQSFWNPECPLYRWTMPDGHEVLVPVKTTQEKAIEIDELGGFKMNFRLTMAGFKKHGRALPANLIHSVDAYICRQMIQRCADSGFWVTPIHDCFYASPKHMNQVRKHYVEILSEIASTNLLENILSQICGRRLNLPIKDNDLKTKVLDAEYALS